MTLQMYLCISAEGTISVKFEYPAKYGICYEKGRGIRKYQDIPAFPEPSIEVNCTGDFMLGVEPILNVLSIDIVDAELELGLEYECKATLHPEQTCFDVSAYAPLLKLSVLGDDEADVLLKTVADLLAGGEMSLTWDIFSSDNAPIHLQMHFEKKSGMPLMHVSECSYREEVQTSKSGHGRRDEEGERPDRNAKDSNESANVPIDEDHFPDAIFRQYVMDSFDLNGNEILEKEEIEKATWIDFSEVEEEKVYECRSIQGVEYLVKLEGLQINNTSVEELDLRENPELFWVEARYCSDLKK